MLKSKANISPAPTKTRWMTPARKLATLKQKAGEALVAAIKNAKDKEKIGTYHGFDIIAHDEGPQSGYRIELRNPETKRPHGSTAMGYQAISPSGALIRLDNEYKGVLKNFTRSPARTCQERI